MEAKEYFEKVARTAPLTYGWNEPITIYVEPSGREELPYRSYAFFSDGTTRSGNFCTATQARKWAWSQTHYVPTWAEVTQGGKYSCD